MQYHESSDFRYWPFSGSKNFHFQYEAKYEAFLVKMSYIFMKIIKEKSFLYQLLCTQRRFEATQK